MYASGQWQSLAVEVFRTYNALAGLVTEGGSIARELGGISKKT